MSTRRLMSLLIAAILAAVALYLLVAAAAYGFQRRLSYHPDTERVAPAARGLGFVREEVLTTPDGQQLVTWRMPAPPGRPTILYFHGNAAGLIDREIRIRIFDRDRYGLLMLAYRGFAGSTGSPGETANVADALLAFDRLVAEGVSPRDIVIFGESIGTGVAAQVAVQRRARALILDSPYTSFVDVARLRFPYLPVDLLLLDRYESKTYIANIGMPLLILHGEADEVVPVAMGREMFKLAREPKRIVTFPGAKHLFHADQGSFDRMREFLEKL